MKKPWMWGLGLLGVMAMTRKGAASGGGPSVPSGYDVTPGERYGPTWKDRRPPGFPADARPTASRAYSEAVLRAAIGALGSIEAVFDQLVWHMAMTESGRRLGIPAHRFDARPLEPGHIPRYAATMVDGLRPSSIEIVTGWGLFGFNRDAWRSLHGVGGSDFPWSCSPADEAARPLRRYLELYSEARAAGAEPRMAARYVRLWQRGVSFSSALLRDARARGWASAWGAVPAAHRSIIERHMTASGIG